MLWGVLKGLASFLIAGFSRFKTGGAKVLESEEKVCFGIGFNLILGLEFLIAADIIRTIIEPALEELRIPGVIAAIRIALAFFLGREFGLS